MVRLASRTARQSSSVISSSGWPTCPATPPAQLTRMSTGPTPPKNSRDRGRDRQVGGVLVHAVDLRAVAPQRAGDAGADAVRRSGHDGRLPGQAAAHRAAASPAAVTRRPGAAKAPVRGACEVLCTEPPCLSSLPDWPTLAVGAAGGLAKRLSSQHCNGPVPDRATVNSVKPCGLLTAAGGATPPAAGPAGQLPPGSAPPGQRPRR